MERKFEFDWEYIQYLWSIERNLTWYDLAVIGNFQLYDDCARLIKELSANPRDSIQMLIENGIEYGMPDILQTLMIKTEHIANAKNNNDKLIFDSWICADTFRRQVASLVNDIRQYVPLERVENGATYYGNPKIKITSESFP